MTISPTPKMASKLGISPEILDEKINHGFITFAKEHHLANSLKTHNHQLLVNPETNEILIRHKKTYITWTQAKTLIQEFQTENKDPSSNGPYSLSLYGYKGLQNKDRYLWKNLKPLLKGDASKFSNHFIKDPLIFDDNLKSYIMEFCSTATESTPRKMAGDHSWIRLYRFKKVDEKIMGKMYSVGFYRPYKHRALFDNFWFPFCPKKGHIIHEVSEEWGMNDQIRTIAKKITQDSYDRIKTKIQSDKNANNTVYQHFEYNCDDYVSDLAELGGLRLPTKRHFLELFTCVHLEDKWNNELSKFPIAIQSTAKLITKFVQAFILMLTPLFNLIFFSIGCGFVSESIKNKSGFRLFTATIASFFDPNKLFVASPWILSHLIKNDVESWRQRKIAKLKIGNEDWMQKRDEIMFDFPKRYKI